MTDDNEPTGPSERPPKRRADGDLLRLAKELATYTGLAKTFASVVQSKIEAPGSWSVDPEPDGDLGRAAEWIGRADKAADALMAALAAPVGAESGGGSVSVNDLAVEIGCSVREVHDWIEEHLDTWDGWEVWDRTAGEGDDVLLAEAADAVREALA